ncbi:glycosyltransferase family 2 protein [Nannocystis punicea]|uniref:Glycosyltransferase family 2 protein n=1 Tax=Nannocystis punicea TaxID=2995304 RepID=A0ABY7H0X0_9BACT|nr:glycosyltransferase family 2 protein [Nannocystis poenicansa]WAS92896.1 glycosyltransferase family 2 protein [Nannocystis poenicansa]
MSESSATSPGPEVSVVIPVYNEEAILRDSVVELVRGLEAEVPAFEVWLAENGSRDRTREIAAELAALDPRVKWFSCPAPNYGAALRMAIEQAAGKFVVCEEIDLCDLAFHRRALALLRAGAADLVVGSKAMPGAHDRRPLGRRAATRAYNGLLRVTLGYRGTDTHGLKAFRRAALLPVVERCIVGHDVFASELVIRAQRDGVAITEIPVELEEKRAPSIHLARRVPRVLKNLARLMAAIHLGRGAKER